VAEPAGNEPYLYYSRWPSSPVLPGRRLWHYCDIVFNQPGVDVVTSRASRQPVLTRITSDHCSVIILRWPASLVTMCGDDGCGLSQPMICLSDILLAMTQHSLTMPAGNVLCYSMAVWLFICWQPIMTDYWPAFMLTDMTSRCNTGQPPRGQYWRAILTSLDCDLFQCQQCQRRRSGQAMT